MTNIKINKSILVLIAISMFVFSGCVKDDFDEPPARTIPVGNLKTIADLRAMFQGTTVKITEEYSVYGVITMDERTGNIYRSAFIEDHTAAINLHLLASGGIYQGDSVRIYLKGLVLSDYNGMLQLDSVDVDENIIKQKTLVDFPPALTTIQDINTGALQARLIKLEDVQFKAEEIGKTYADPVNLYSENRMLEDCFGNEVIVRTSGYASFAGDTVPAGKGTIIAVVSEYSGDMQLYIRSMSEVVMEGERCGAGPLELKTIQEIRSMYTGSTINLPTGIKIQGIIISDIDNSNLSSRNAFIQDESGDGIALRFTANHSFKLGHEVEINISGQELSEYNGLLQINNLPNANAFDQGAGTMPTPIDVAIEDILDDFEDFESRLVRIPNVTISNAGGYTTYKYTCILTDATGSIDMYTTDYATFANTTFPTVPVHITGIVSQYNDPQIIIRNLGDVVNAK